MTQHNIARLRLNNQQLLQTSFKTIEEMVRWMGAMQAQDFGMMKWAVGIRMPGTSEQMVEEAISNAQVIRTHLMRPTWHLVSASDVYWILELTAPHIKSGLRSRHKQLELTDSLITTCKTAVETWLRDGNHLTRKEITQQFFDSKLIQSNEQVTHILVICELDRLICSGRQKGKNPTYALLEERVEKPQSIPREEASSKLAHRYFTSHGPATLRDFIWWSGLPVKDAREALNSVKSGLELLVSDDQEFWFPIDGMQEPDEKDFVHLLPAYDEFIISYKDRRASLNNENQPKAISLNGFFYPVVLVNGKATGTWRRLQEKDRTVVEIDYFEGIKTPGKSLLQNASERFGDFLNSKADLRNHH